MLYTLNGEEKDSYNDIGSENVVCIKDRDLGNESFDGKNKLRIDIEPHSVNVLIVK